MVVMLAMGRRDELFALSWASRSCGDLPQAKLDLALGSRSRARDGARQGPSHSPSIVARSPRVGDGGRSPTVGLLGVSSLHSASDGAELSDPGGITCIAKDTRSRQPGHDLLEEFQPFPAQTVFDGRAPIAGRAESGAQARAATSCVKCEYRRRLRCRVRKVGAIAASCARDRAGPTSLRKAASFLSSATLRGSASAPLGRRAKNRGPLQAVPVMARAMAERLA